MSQNKETPVIGVSRPLEPSDDIPLFLDLSDSDKRLNVLASGSRIKDKEGRKDILVASGDLVYQFEFRASGSLPGQFKVDSVRLEMTGEKAMTYFNAVQSVEIAKVRRQLSWIQWIMGVSAIDGLTAIRLT